MKRYNRFYLVVIADYNDDDAHGIVHDNLFHWFNKEDLSIIEYDRVDVAAFNTVETGYVLARRALNPLSSSRRQVFFVNTAPRMDSLSERPLNQGEAFVWVQLRNGKQIFAVNSGFSLSFIKPEIASIRTFNLPEAAAESPLLADVLAPRSGHPANFGVGQFRSGYLYPIVVARVLAGRDEAAGPLFASLVGRAEPALEIPDVPSNAVVYRDGYGNLKASIEPQELAGHVGKFAVVDCNNREVIAHIRQAIFDVPQHHFSIAPGSTVFGYSDGTRRQLVEVVLRGGHAAFALRPDTNGASLPAPGDRIRWRVAEDGDFARLGFARDGTPPPRLLECALRS